MRAEPIIGRRVAGLVRPDVPEHHIACPGCGFALDMRRLDRVLGHDCRKADSPNVC